MGSDHLTDSTGRTRVPTHRLEQSSSSSQPDQAELLDAGALFVLKSRGSWLHCGYHLTTSIVAPALLSLPFAFALVGWVTGVFCLIIGASVTFYAYNLLSLVLEHHAELGQRQLRFRDMARDILGPRWDWYYVGPLQFCLCYATGLKLYEFVVIAGVLMLALAQIPSFHSLRHINLVSLILSLAYSTCAVAGSIYIGKSQKAPPKDYSVNGDGADRMFGVYNAISIIATAYGNGIIPEIQVYLQLTNEVLERKLADAKSKQFSARNVVPRLISRSLSVALATTIAAMFPFFGDINAVIGAFGYIPLDFVLPMLFYHVTFKPSRRTIMFWINTSIAVIFTVLAVLGAIAGVRQIVIDAKLYRLFANV